MQQLDVFNLALNTMDQGPSQQFLAPNQSMTATVWA